MARFAGNDFCNAVVLAATIHQMRELGPVLPGPFQQAMECAGVIVRSPLWDLPLSRMAKAAACDVGVLIFGETGTGKEIFAQAIHYGGPRADGPFVPLNCGAVPDNLFENELFGHERGAYTDARDAAPGLIAQAEDGTLFLDEVEALSSNAQVKLLRFLQDRRYRALGASKARDANVRIVAATNEDLMERVKGKTFREDLFYRLRIVGVSLPPLRERKEDIRPLAEQFIQHANEQYNARVSDLTPDAWQRLHTHHWPGNVRELRNLIESAVALSSSSVLAPEDFDLDLPVQRSPAAGQSMRSAKQRLIDDFERDYLVRALSSTGGNISAAARTAGKNRRAFFALLKKHGLATA